MEQRPKFQGCLEKQGKIAKAWKKCWFILQDSQLTYVKANDKKSSQGHIDMAQAQSVRSVNAKSGHQFEIVTRSRNHYLNAESVEQRDKWVKVLHDAMAWYSRHSSSSSVGGVTNTGSNSVRASCNSIEDDDYGYSTVNLSPAGSPTRSSGYSTTSDVANDHLPAPNGVDSSRDSGMSDIMYVNPDYGKHASEKRAQKNVRSTLRDSSKNSLYEDIPAENPRQSQHEGLRRLYPSRKSKLAEKTDSVTSDASGIYDSVHEPVNIAISHIVKGYANIARNKGPQEEKETDDGEEDGDGDYDDVFVASSRDSKTSSVVMRKSAIQRDNEPSYASVGEGGATPGTTPHYAMVNKLPGPKPRKSAKPSVNIRASALPQEVNELFEFKPVEELPNPRIELTHRTSFNDIRQFLANNRTPDEYYVANKPDESGGKAVRALQDYLAMLG